MRCSGARKLISDYVDNNLKTSQRASLEQHLRDCPDCQQLLIEFQGIVRSAKELEEFSPSDQLWGKIKTRLKTEKQEVIVPQFPNREWYHLLFRPPKLKYALSAALVLVVVIGAVTFGFWYWKGRGVLGGNNLQRYTLAKLEKAERHYKLAIKALAEVVTAQEESIDPQAAEVFRINLRIIDASIKTCKQAVMSEPENIEARNYLLAVYREKLDLLNSMMEIKRKFPPEKMLGRAL